MPVSVRLAAASDVPENTVRAFEHNGQRIAVYHCGGQWYATSDICSHDYAELSEGFLDTDDCTIECPLHGSRFQIATGAVLSLPAYQPIPTYPIRIVDGDIVVELVV